MSREFVIRTSFVFYSNDAQNLEYLKSPYQPVIKNASDIANSAYTSLLRCAISILRNMNAPAPIKPKNRASLPSLFQFNY